MARAWIAGTGAYLPAKVLTNFDLEKMVDTSDEWITQRTGIKERHIAAEDEAVSDLVIKAARPALEMAGAAPQDIDAVIICTITPDNSFPSTACLVQKGLGLRPGIPAFDISAACSGFVYGLIIADSLIRTGAVKCVLLAGAEILSRITNWTDRNTCVLFGDGAGVAIVAPSPDPSRGLVASCWHADGSLGDLLIQPAGGSRLPASAETVAAGLHTIHMSGNEVFKHAVRAMSQAAETVLNQARIPPEEVKLFVPHQANIRILEATCQRTRIPLERTVLAIDRIGNTSAATIPIGLDMAVREGRISAGDAVLLDAFGGGFTWGAALVRW
ncbi:MAG TPA: beta-ketoacyl-ACP synthase III [Planctomycetota bacterium]|jgi:3-oxoacyl-[acyl-carrier-protein] synthase-3|nr:ketoacyl-ACP synthase III [Planctomycetota bacterium]OQC19363.1 MAG: 3-oxoacyl-(acyl-carrier-protein) synthase 3 [Planctomycetes bacterium ADurb.Bin069]HNR99975.1 beta-ketoacyl-ACP synthase III [Planctomycetota bacterium]HNU25683.1 beta-ketoacyl-ACP synthase III [Planctomycetota bacterium]HOE31085.1 beta-ketoacyl-ACP synthase III [Planctomycetota bacterium]